MKRKISFIVAASVVVAMLLAVLAAGCISPTSENDVTGITVYMNKKKVSTKTLTAHQGNSNVKFTADVQGDANNDVTWRLTGNKDKKNTSISATGRLRISEDEPVDRILTITATSNKKDSIYKTAKVKVIAKDDPGGDDTEEPDPEFVIDANVPSSIAPGQSLALSVSSEGTKKPSIKFEIISDGHSSTTKIDPATGVLTISADEKAASITIRVISTDDETVFIDIPIIIITQTEPNTPPNSTQPSFTITYGPFTNGNVTGPAQAKENDTVTLTIVTNNSTLQSLTVSRTSGTGTVTVTTVSSTTCTFTMPPSNVSIAATFQAKEPENPPIGGWSTDYFSNDFDSSLCSFYDKFDGNSLDLTKWGYQNGNGQQPDNYGNWAWGNEEKQSYHPSGVIVADGKLSLRVTKTPRNSMQYTSGKIVTANSISEPGNKFSQTYGRFEAKIRMTKTEKGIWPAFWMMPIGNNYGNGWPYNGEIDIMEMVGSKPNEASSTLHWRPNWPNITAWQNQYRGFEYRFPNNSNYTQWHIFGVQWEEGVLIFLIDGVEHTRLGRNYWNTAYYTNAGYGRAAPFDRDFHLILNCAVGGWFDGGALPEDSSLPIAMEVDWVRAYTLANNPWPIQPGTVQGHVTNN